MAASNTNTQVAEAKESFFKMAGSVISSSKVGWSRARQYTEEKMGNAEKTEFDAQFDNLCERADKTKLFTEKILASTEAMLQPNPASRMEEFMYEKLDKKNPSRPTNAFMMGQVMQDAGRELGPGTSYGASLAKVGTTIKKIGNAEKDYQQKAMSHFLHPLKSTLENEIKTITKERRALEAKRLDLDSTKSRMKKASYDKVRQAEQEQRIAQSEFDRQFELTKLMLDGIATTQNNHLRALQSFVEAMSMYFTQAQQYCLELQREMPSPLDAPRADGPSAPPMYTPVATNGNSGDSPVKRRAKVLYDYDADNIGELSLLADEVITVYQLDDDTMMGERNGKKGKVPVAYIEFC